MAKGARGSDGCEPTAAPQPTPPKATPKGRQPTGSPWSGKELGDQGKARGPQRAWISYAIVLLAGTLVVVAAADRRQNEPLKNTTADSPLALPTTGSSSPSALDGGRSPATSSAVQGSASCSFADQGWGSYAPWRGLPIGQVLVPQPAPTEQFDLLVHFHGADAVRKLLAPATLGLVIVGVDAGSGAQKYEEKLYGSDSLEDLIGSVLDVLQESQDEPPMLRHLIISSWSAGYGAVHQLLMHHPRRPAAVVLLDSLHASYAGDSAHMRTAGLEPFLAYARLAAAGEALMVVTHSEIRPPGYASTSETASYLLRQLGGQRRYAGLESIAGVEHKTSFDENGLHIRGYTGTTKQAHCAQLRLLLPIVKDDLLPALARIKPDAGPP